MSFDQTNEFAPRSDLQVFLDGRLIPAAEAKVSVDGGARRDARAQAISLIDVIVAATLLHDDVVDHSELRRGKDTANSLFGNEASVLVGDFLLGQATMLRDRLLVLIDLSVLP